MSEFSKEIQISIEVAAELFTNLIVKTYQGVAGFVKDKNKEHDFFGTATKKYVGGLIGRYNTVQVLGMREPVPLKSLFVRVNILEKISARAGLRPEELAEFFDFDRRAFGKNRETVDGEIIVNKLRKFIVLGKPGAGKTTYLKYLTLMMLDKFSQIERRRLPIFVTLRAWADESVPLMDFIAQEFDTCGFEEAKTFVERMLKNGDCLVLFDGLDEVSETAKQDDIIRQIKNFADKYAENQFVVSCRVAAYNHEFEGFTEVEMADFNEKQMETFIRNWFQGEPKVADECWQRLRNSPPLRELASVPLLLALLCLEYGESNDFPPNRAELYERAIETLLKKWDESRQVRRDEVYKQLTIKRKKEMFARIAFGTFSENEYFIRERTLAKMIEKYLENLPGFNAVELEPDGHDILRAIEARHGIFVERAQDVYSFAHLTFQEYFTAKYIVDNQLNGSLEKLVEQHLYDLKWKEVFLLVAGMLDNADELLLQMRMRANEVMNDLEVNGLFQMVQPLLLPTESRYPNVVRRNAAVTILYSMVHSATLVSDVARLLSSLLQLDEDMAMVIARYLAVAADLQNALPQNLIQAQGAELSIDLHKLSACAEVVEREKIKGLDKYYLANEMILKCIEAGCYVSNPIREKLLHEMFLPKEDLKAGGL